MTYYKILKRVNNELRSLATYAEFSLLYVPNDFTYPQFPNSKLFCYNDFLSFVDNLRIRWEECESDASKFYSQIAIYKCEVINAVDCKTVACINTEMIQMFWTNTLPAAKMKKDRILKRWYEYRAPYGTVICDAIKIVKEIQPNLSLLL